MKTTRRTAKARRLESFPAAVALVLCTVTAAYAQTDRTESGAEAGVERPALAELFAGDWRVTLVNGENLLRGLARVDGSGISLTLAGPEGETRYRSTQTEAMRYAEGTGPFRSGLTVTFQELGGPATDATMSALPESERLLLPEGEKTLTAELEGTRLALPIQWEKTPRKRLRVQIATRGDPDRYEGRWNEQTADGLKGGGVTAWRRGTPEIEGILVLDAQGDAEAGYIYPFTDSGKAVEDAKPTRDLVIYGRHLPRPADGISIQSAAEEIAYTPQFKADNATLQRIRGALGQAGVKEPETFDIIWARARLSPGITPGTRQLTVDGAPGRWPLLFADQQARLKFVRPGQQLLSEPTMLFFPRDLGTVELAFDRDMPFKEIGVNLYLLRKETKEAEDLGMIAASRQDSEKPIFRTPPLFFYDAADSTVPEPPETDAIPVAIGMGDAIAARLYDRAEGETRPALAVAGFAVGTPEELGPLWRDALGRVAACDGDPFDGDPLYALQESVRLSKVTVGEFLIKVARWTSPLAYAATELRGFEEDGPVDFNPSVQIYKGDHAAAILIRDELVKVLPRLQPFFIGLAESKAAREAFRQKARTDPAMAAGPFWDAKAVYMPPKPPWWRRILGAEVTKTMRQGIGMPLRDTLNEAAVAKRLGLSPEEARRWADDQLRRAAKVQNNSMERALGRAQKAGDCNLEELIVIAGQKTDPVVARILPRLVKKLGAEDGSGGYWAPDHLARGYVQRLHTGGAAVRALNQYADLDDTYKAMAVALVTAGAGAALSAAGYAGLGTLAVLAGDVIDAAYFGLKDVEDYYQAEGFFDFAKGVAPVVGADILREAEVGRQSGVMAAVGVIAPALGGLSGLKDLRKLKNIRKGRALLEAKGADVLNHLDDLPAAERAAVAAYYTDLLSRSRHLGADGLDAAEKTALDALQNHVARKGVPPPPAGPARAKAPAEPRTSAPADTPAGSGVMRPDGMRPGVEPPADTVVAKGVPKVVERLQRLGVDESAENLAVKGEIHMRRGWSADEATIIAAWERGVPAERLMAVTGKTRAELEETLRAYARYRGAGGTERLDRLVNRYFDRPADTHATLPPPGSGTSALPETVRLDAPGGIDPHATLPPPDASSGGLPETLRLDAPGGADPHATLPPPRSSGANLPETVRLDAPGGTDPHATLPPSGSSGADLPETVRMDGPGTADPHATVPPGASAEDLTETVATASPRPAAAPGTAASKGSASMRRLGQLYAREFDALGRGIPGSQPRLARIGDVIERLKALPAGERKLVLELAASLQRHGVAEMEAYGHAALFSGRLQGAGYGRVTVAEVLAHGLMFYGERAISVRQFMQATGLPHSSARHILEQEAALWGGALPGDRLVPLRAAGSVE